MNDINTRLEVYDLNGKVVDKYELDKDVFDGNVNKTLLYQANKMYESALRRGTASAKSRSEVSGGGSKPWRQKGTGRARVGSSRNPLWRHGGVIFPPKPRDFSFTMPKKAVKKALLSSLNARLSEGSIKLVVKIEMSDPKTKDFKKIIDNLKLDGKTLVITDEMENNVKLASRNLQDVTLKEGRNINARDVLLNKNLLIEKDAMEKLARRMK